ncbi:MAG: hypothetical protein H6685_05270 [Deltaproteobacteria bacterium]|nr:hypothetical protein [Deltaproteobacteria bacterium]
MNIQRFLHLDSTRRRFGLALIFLLVAVFLLPVACGGDDDDDDSTAATDDDTADDDTGDDDTGDDDTGDDDTSDDDTSDDDTADDDTGDDDFEERELGWILLDEDRGHVSDVLTQAVDYGVDHVQLSHDLIMDIDEINESEDKAAEIQSIAQEAHNAGLEVWVWAHEFARETYLLCFDPEDDLWDRRADAYRDALDRVPEIDGVILMFGSSDAEPWYVPCFCKWCKDLEPTGNPALDLIHSRPVDRLQQIYDTVGGVVLDEYGKQLRVRTFMHQPSELEWLGESLRTEDDSRIQVMSKDMPQDWQPYYPLNPLVGDIGERNQIFELDLGHEYWGKSKLLNSLVDYLSMRLHQAERAGGIDGAAARVERGGDHALGTPNEINFAALTAYFKTPGATPDGIYADWLATRYGVSGEALETLTTIFRTSHFANRKMYYTLGMWSLEKGSDIPDNAGRPAQLRSRDTTPYDADWASTFDALNEPTARTLVDLWQESTEALELAQDNLDRLESVEEDFAESGDYDELHGMLELQRDCAKVWRLVIDTIWRRELYDEGDTAQSDFIEYNADTLSDLADAMQSRWGAGISPGNPGRIRAFVEDLRTRVPEQVDSEEYSQPTIYDVAATNTSGNEWSITWKTTEAMTSLVEWSGKLPLYPNSSGEQESLKTDHAVTVTFPADGPVVYRVAGHANATLIRSGDYWVRMGE